VNDKGRLDGHKVVPVKDVIEREVWFEKADRRVALDKIGEVKVSTVFLGLDHGFGGKSLWFETMVFGGKLDQEQARYETWDEAVTGHKAMVKRVSEGGKVNDKLIKLLAKLMEGLQCPGSIGGVLGTAREPWVSLIDRWHIHGWMTADEIEKLIRENEPSLKVNE